MTDTTKKQDPAPQADPAAAAAATAEPGKANPHPKDPAPAADPAAQADPAGGDKKPDDKAAAPAIYKPDGIDDHMVGKTDQETIDNLVKRTKGLRDELAQKKGLPEKFDDYKIEFSAEETEKYLSPGADGKDPVLEIMRKTAFENGVPQETAKQLFSKFVEEMYRQLEEGAAQGHEDDKGAPQADFEFKGMGGAEKAKPVQEAANAWIDGLKTQGKVSDNAVYELKLLATHAGGLEALEALRVMSGEKPIPVNIQGNSGGQGLTEADLHAKMRDPRYWKTKDPQFIAEVTEGFKTLYGGDAA